MTVKAIVIVRCLLLAGLVLLQPSLLMAQEEEAIGKQMSALVDAERHAAEKMMAGRLSRVSASAEMDIHYHRCDWYADPAVRAISGSVTTGFIARSTLARIYFDLKANMQVDSVRYRNARIPVIRSGDSLGLILPAPISAGSNDSVTIFYHGAPDPSGFGSFVSSNHAGVPALFTLSEPYGARDWWPCKNSVDDKIDSLDVVIRCPAAYTGVSNGLRLASYVSGDTAVSVWKHRYPITSYLVAIAVTNYERFERSVALGDQLLPMETFCFPESLADFQRETQTTLDALQFFHALFGPYPFIREKYGHTQFGWNGGQEHQTNSFVKELGENLCAHELAHQWFGDKVTCGAFADIWLNEGFATHAASMFGELRHPENVQNSRRAEIDRITSVGGGSVFVRDTASVSRIFDYRLSYLKGSHLLYMLRLQLGETNFWKGVRNYLNDPRLAYKYARSADLKGHLEAACICSLDSFFRQWVYGEGYPSYRLEWTQIGTETVRFRIGQTTADPSVSFFQLKVPVRFYQGGKDTTLLVNHDFSGQTFTCDIGFVADSVAFDPELWLISRANTVSRNDSLDRPVEQVLLYPNPFQSEIQVQLYDFPGDYVAIGLYALNGALQQNEVVPLYRGRAFVRLDGRRLSAGNYLLRILDQDGKQQVRQVQHW